MRTTVGPVQIYDAALSVIYAAGPVQPVHAARQDARRTPWRFPVRHDPDPRMRITLNDAYFVDDCPAKIKILLPGDSGQRPPVMFLADYLLDAPAPTDVNGVLKVHVLAPGLWCHHPETLAPRAAIVEDSASLGGAVPGLLTRDYGRARQEASIETHLPLATFSQACPWTPDQILDADFWPEADTP